MRLNGLRLITMATVSAVAFLAAPFAPQSVSAQDAALAICPNGTAINNGVELILNLRPDNYRVTAVGVGNFDPILSVTNEAGDTVCVDDDTAASSWVASLPTTGVIGPSGLNSQVIINHRGSQIEDFYVVVGGFGDQTGEVVLFVEDLAVSNADGSGAIAGDPFSILMTPNVIASGIPITAYMISRVSNLDPYMRWVDADLNTFELGGDLIVCDDSGNASLCFGESYPLGNSYIANDRINLPGFQYDSMLSISAELAGYTYDSYGYINFLMTSFNQTTVGEYIPAFHIGIGDVNDADFGQQGQGEDNGQNGGETLVNPNGTTDVTCTDSADLFAGNAGAAFSVFCPANCGAQDGNIWGTNVYTSDSPICVAAQHTGVLTEDGGEVTLVIRAGQTSYEGSRSNGITSSEEGPWNRSYSFEGAGGNVSEPLPIEATPTNSVRSTPTPSAANDVSVGGTIRLSESVDGSISSNVTAFAYTFEATSTDPITITLIADPSSNLDPFVQIIDDAGNVLAENDDSDDATVGARNSLIENFVLPGAGTYTIIATRFIGTGDFTLSLDAGTPGGGTNTSGATATTAPVSTPIPNITPTKASPKRAALTQGITTAGLKSPVRFLSRIRKQQPTPLIPEIPVEIGGFVAVIPEGWVTQVESDTVYIGSSDVAIETASNTIFLEDGITMSIASEESLIEQGIERDSNLNVAMERLIVLIKDSEEYQVGDFEPFDDLTHPALYVLVENDSAQTLALFTIDTPGGIVVAAVVASEAPETLLEQIAPILDTIAYADSVSLLEVTPEVMPIPESGATESTPVILFVPEIPVVLGDELVAVIPEGWATEVTEDNLYIGSTAEAIDTAMFRLNEFSGDGVVISVSPLGTLAESGIERDTDLNVAMTQLMALVTTAGYNLTPASPFEGLSSPALYTIAEAEGYQSITFITIDTPGGVLVLGVVASETPEIVLELIAPILDTIAYADSVSLLEVTPEVTPIPEPEATEIASVALLVPEVPVVLGDEFIAIIPHDWFVEDEGEIYVGSSVEAIESIPGPTDFPEQGIVISFIQGRGLTGLGIDRDGSLNEAMAQMIEVIAVQFDYQTEPTALYEGLSNPALYVQGPNFELAQTFVIVTIDTPGGILVLGVVSNEMPETLLPRITPILDTIAYADSIALTETTPTATPGIEATPEITPTESAAAPIELPNFVFVQTPQYIFQAYMPET